MSRLFLWLALLALSLGVVSAATVTGRVVDLDGKPIKGANVWLNLYPIGKTLDLLTDDKGNFADEGDLTFRQPDAFRSWVIAYAPGYALTRAQLNKNYNAVTLNALVTLNPGTTISGTVVAAEGKPLAGVPVYLHSYRDRENNFIGVPEEWRARFTVNSAADGSWTLPGIPLAGSVSLALNDNRYVHDEREITLVAGVKADSVRFTVRPGATVTGRVLSPEGAPATDALVYIQAQQAAPAGAIYATGKTAADGSYRFVGLSTCAYTIGAYSEKQMWIAEPMKDIPLLEGKQIAAPDLQTRTGAALEGMVVDAETGTPIPGVSVQLFHGKTIDNESKNNPALAEQLYLIARPIYDTSVHDKGRSDIEGLGSFTDISLRTITLAALLQKKADLDAMLAQLRALIKQHGNNCWMIVEPLFEAAGRVSPEFVCSLYESIDDQSKNVGLADAVTSMAQHDPEAAPAVAEDD